MPKLLAVALVALVGCSTGPVGYLSALDEARARWADAGITHYQMVLHRGCFCGGPSSVRIEVNGTTITRTPLGEGGPVPAGWEDYYPDVAGLFDVVAREAVRPAAALQVEYDAARGFPTLISVDPIGNAIDDEYGYTVTDFEVLGQ
ncbi:MAG: DUF6174 domain-containing protein [Gemmatimonadales bacterium]